MSNEKHTQGELKAYPIELRHGLPYTPVAINTLIAKVYSEAFGNHLESEANARRIAACWNACDGISTENLEQNIAIKELANRYNTVIAQRDELLQGLKNLKRAYVNLLEAGRNRILDMGGQCDDVPTMEASDPYLRDASAAIAKATGGAA